MGNTTSPGLTHRARPSWQSIRRIIGERVDAKRSAGIVVGVIDPGGRRVTAYGDPGPGQPPLDASSVLEIGSITKVFTATLRDPLGDGGGVCVGVEGGPVLGELAVTVGDLGLMSSSSAGGSGWLAVAMASSSIVAGKWCGSNLLARQASSGSRRA